MAADHMMDHEPDGLVRDDDIDDMSHKKLLNAVSLLYRKQRIGAPKRNEPAQQISEFNLSKSDYKKKLVASDLLSGLDKKMVHKEIANKIQSIQKRAKPLPKPLEKFQSEKITREMGFHAVKTELFKWEATIQKNRAADQLQFPLKDEKISMDRDDNFLNKFTKPSELELKMAEVLKKNLLVQEGKEEDEDLEKLTLDEVLKRRNMIAKLRARESYRIAKAVRQNKIKSKKYHRMLKRDRIKKELKEFELLQKTDPEAALAKLEKVERARAEERISLRHKNTGKWAKGLAIRAKYDVEARAQLADNLRKSRELTEKIKSSMVTDSEDEVDGDNDVPSADRSAGNPWVGNPDKEIESFVSGYRRYWENQTKLKEDAARKKSDIAAGRKASKGRRPEVEKDDQESNASEESNEKRTPDHESDSVSVSNGLFVGVDQDEENKAEDTGDTSSVKSKYVSAIEMVNLGDGEEPENRKVFTERLQTRSSIVTATELDVSRSEQKTSITKKQKRKRKAKSISFDKTGEWSVIEVYPALDEEKSSSNVSLVEETKVSAEGHGAKLVEKRKIQDLFDEVETRIEVSVPSKVAQMKKRLKLKSGKRTLDKATDNGDRQVRRKSDHNDLSFKKTKLSVDESLVEEAREGISSGMSDVQKLIDRVGLPIKAPEAKLPDIDPQKFIPVKTQKLKTSVPQLEEGGDYESEDEQHLNLMEAFADDDIADEFRREKEEEEEGSKPKEIDLSLPGWGDWAGAGLAPKKKKHLLIKFPKTPRKDSNKKTVIVNDDPPKRFKDLQISDLPTQFSNVAAYEATIRAPIGDTWIPQAAHAALTQPQVVTKMGAIIEPMDASQLPKEEKLGNSVVTSKAKGSNRAAKKKGRQVKATSKKVKVKNK